MPGWDAVVGLDDEPEGPDDEKLRKLLAEQYPGVPYEEARALFSAGMGAPFSPEGGHATVGERLQNVSDSAKAFGLGAAKTALPAAIGIGVGATGGVPALLASLPAGYLAGKGQSKLLEAVRPGAAGELQEVAEAHPVADFAGELAPTAGAFTAGVPSSLKQAGLGAGVGVGLHGIGSLMEGQMPGLLDTVLAGGLGATLKARPYLHAGLKPRAPKAAPGKATPPTAEPPLDFLKTPAKVQPGNDPNVQQIKILEEVLATKNKPRTPEEWEAQADALFELSKEPPPMPGTERFDAGRVEGQRLSTQREAAREARRRAASGDAPESTTPPAVVAGKPVAPAVTDAPPFPGAEKVLSKSPRTVELLEERSKLTNKSNRPMSGNKTRVDEIDAELSSLMVWEQPKTPVRRLSGEERQRLRQAELAAAQLTPEQKVATHTEALGLVGERGPNATARRTSIENQLAEARAAMFREWPQELPEYAALNAEHNRQSVLEAATAKMHREFGQPDQSPPRVVDGKPVPPSPEIGESSLSRLTDSIIAKAAAQRPPELLTPAEAVAYGITPGDHASATMRAYAAGERVNQETAQAIPAIQNAQEVIKRLPKRETKAPRFPEATQGYKTTMELLEPRRKTWAETEATVKAMGGDIEYIKAHTKEGENGPELALAYANNASNATTGVIRAGLAVKADPSPENIAGLEKAYVALEEAMQPLRGHVTNTAQALSILGGIKGHMDVGETLLSIPQMAKKLPGRSPARGGGPRGRRSEGFGARAKGERLRPAAPAKLTPREEFWAGVSDQIGLAKTPEEVFQILQTRIPKKAAQDPGFGAKVQEYIQANLLSNFKQVGKETLGNATMLFTRQLETYQSAAVGAAKAAVGIKSPDRVYVKDALHSTAGLVAYGRDLLSSAGLKAQWRRFQMEVPNDTFRSDFKYPKAIPGRLGKAVRTSFRLAEANAHIFGEFAYKSKVYELASNVATSEGLKGQAAKDRMNYIIDHPEAVKTPRGTVAELATAQAIEDTFISKNSLAERVSKAKQHFEIESGRLRGLNVASLFLPFHTTRLNVAAAAYKHTPLALLPGKFGMPSVKAEIAAGGKSKDLAYIRMVNGTALASYFVYQYLNGKLTGSRPTIKDDQFKEQASKDTATWQADSIVTDNGTHIGLGNFPIAGDLMKLVTGYAEVAETAGEDQKLALVYNLGHAFGKWIEHDTFINSASTITEFFEGGMADGMLKMSQMAIPKPLTALAYAADPHQRKAKTLLQVIKKNIPGAKLEHYMDLYGEPIRSESGGFLARLASPLPIMTTPNDPARTELKRLKLTMSRPDRVQLGKKLTPEEYETYQETQGRIAYVGVEGLVKNNADWAATPDNEKRVKIREAFDEAAKLTREHWAAMHPLEAKAYQDMLERRRMGFLE